MLIQRTLITPERRTSIALEAVFWESIDSLSQGEWQPWAREVLKDKPANEGRATYLRTLVHHTVVTELLNRRLTEEQTLRQCTELDRVEMMPGGIGGSYEKGQWARIVDHGRAIIEKLSQFSRRFA